MRLFVSYSRSDRAPVKPLVDGLTAAGHDVWFDQEIRGGEDFWDRILDRIRAADVFVAVLSRKAMSSSACTIERHYARDLGKPVLPVMVEPVSAQILPPDLVRQQYIDFCRPDLSAAFRLSGALAALPPAPPLPDPLPPAPSVPSTYVSEISRLVYSPSMSREQQFSVVAELREAVRDPEGYDAAIDLARTMTSRSDLLAAASRQLDEVLASPRPDSEPEPAPEPTPAHERERERAPEPEPEPEPAPKAEPGGPVVLIEGIAFPQDALLVGGRCYALRGATGAPERTEVSCVDVADGTVVAARDVPRAAQIAASPGGAVVSDPTSVVVFDPDLSEVTRWSPGADHMIVDVRATAGCAWALVTGPRASIYPRFSRGTQADVTLWRCSFADGRTHQFELGSDTFWTDPPHFRGFQLLTPSGPAGAEVLALKCEWHARTFVVHKVKKACLVTDDGNMVEVLDAGAYEWGGDQSADLRQVVRHGEHLLLARYETPGVRAKAQVVDRHLTEVVAELDCGGSTPYWLPGPPPVLLSVVPGTQPGPATVHEVDPATNTFVARGQLDGSMLMGTFNHLGVVRDFHLTSATNEGAIWWGVSNPAGLACLVDGELRRFPTDRESLVLGIRDQILLTLAQTATGTFQLITQPLPG